MLGWRNPTPGARGVAIARERRLNPVGGRPEKSNGEADLDPTPITWLELFGVEKGADWLPEIDLVIKEDNIVFQKKK